MSHFSNRYVLPVLLCTTFFSTVVYAMNGTVNEEKLLSPKTTLLVHIVFRHGARTPASTYPKDPLVDFDYAPYGWGQLTNKGKNDLYQLGMKIQEKFSTYLGAETHPNASILTTIQTTDVDRTKQSAQIVAAGIWQPKSDTSVENKWDPSTWSPLPSSFQPLKEDNLLLVREPCPKYSLELDKIEREFQQNQQAQFQTVFDELSNYTGFNVTTPEQVYDIYGTLKAQEEFGLKLPDWTKKFYPDTMEQLSKIHFQMTGKTNVQKRLKGGLFLKHIISDWQNKWNDSQQSSSSTKLKLYCGHDSTIANILSALNVFDGHVPNYAETIIFELATINNVPGIIISLLNEQGERVITPFCAGDLSGESTSGFCPLEIFIEKIQDNIPGDWHEECQIDDKHYKERDAPPP